MREVVSSVDPNVRKGDCLDIKPYVKLKIIPGNDNGDNNDDNDNGDGDNDDGDNDDGDDDDDVDDDVDDDDDGDDNDDDNDDDELQYLHIKFPFTKFTKDEIIFHEGLTFK